MRSSNTRPWSPRPRAPGRPLKTSRRAYRCRPSFIRPWPPPSGNFSVVLPGLERKDEIGDVSNAVEKFKVLAVEKARRETEDATQRMKSETDRQAEVARLEAERQDQAAQAQAKVSEEQNRAVGMLAEGLQKLSEGELTFRLGAGFSQAYRRIKPNFNSPPPNTRPTISPATAPPP